MELNEQDLVVEVAKGGVSEDFGKGFGVGVVSTVAFGLAVKLVGRFVIKPIIKKRKAKKENEEDLDEKVTRLNKEFDEDEEDLDE